MDLVKLLQINQQCNKIYNIIDTKLPHFQIQLYIDVYGYSSIDGNESFFLEITENSLQDSVCLSTSLGKSLQQCSGYNNELIRKSFFKEISHSQEQVNLEIWSTTNQEFADEAYLFRNVQLILDRCYKTCKTCSGQGKEQCLTCYNDISLSSSNSCDSFKDRTDQKFLQIPDGCKDKCDNNKDYDEDYVCIEDINLQDKCEDNCLKCTSTQSCLICKPQNYLYFGQCMDQCPEYTKIYGTNCLSIVDIIQKNNNLRVKQLVREFYDLSTTKSSTDTIFQFISSSNSFNFQKGNAIYYSYFSNKRIFGGPLVWVNAAFKFTKNWTEEFQFIKIFFEVILGDISLNNNKFTYKLNDQQLETITLQENYSGQNPNIQDQIWPNDYQFNIYIVDKSIHYQMSTNKQLTMEIKCQNNHELAFCGIQNMVVVGILNCEPEYYFDYYNYESGRNHCIPICGDKIIVGDEECDDGNNDPFDGCFNCKYQCEEHCDNCIYGYCLRKKTIYRQSSFKIEIEYNLAYYLDVISLSCIFKCSICINNLCLQCSYGYYLNTYNNLCETLCGDSINQGNEQCDDGNSDNYDGCSNCELIQYEKCDIEQDIQKYHCAVCYYGKCLKCNEGYILNDDLCISICGDGLINPIEEECDVQSGDGCIDCKIQNGYVCGKQHFSTCKTCDKECTQCVSLDRINLICKSCIDGYYNVEDKCLLCDSNCINCKLQSNLCIIIYNFQNIIST
ncbi:unnamed protein product [Paramecium primaurelia]|uniref:Insulin-like growth factor binding protein, N-terminal n=1 Tax=Paramecium primaurelia TaxID=5886 RepID=A0A8S1Q9W8_PARPR|nr:unnamed protein product [Paramecium primaurelia]